MTLRFTPNRFAISCAALVASLAVTSIPPAFAQAAKPTAQEQSPYQGTVVEEIVARVNDQVISRSDYARSEQDLQTQAQQQQWTQQQIFEQKRELLRDLIDRQLLLSKAKELDITGETELVKRLDDMRKQNNLPSMEALQKAAEDQGVSWEDFKQSIRNQIISQQVIRDEVGRHVNVTPSELQGYYNQHKQEFDLPEQVRLSEILISTANPDDASQVDAAKKKADDVYAKLQAGGSFADLAKSTSGGPTAAQGGDLGDFKRGQLAKQLEDPTFNLKPGQYTQPIRTKQGFVILQVVQHNAGGVQSYKDVEPQIEDAVGMTKMGPALRDYLTKLREDAYINIKAGYEDSGASPNEMKPVYSAYAPPTPKKHVKVTRTRYYQQRGRGAKQKTTETAAAAPAAPEAPKGVPSLADVPQGSAAAAPVVATPGSTSSGTTAAATTTPAATGTSANSQVATAKAPVQKPGKKEKIRYGQAPRETLPAAATKSEDAGANTGETGDQVASNTPPSDLKTLNPDGSLANPNEASEKKAKTRLSARPKDPKSKKDKVDPFAPPPITDDEVAAQKQQEKPLGLNGDTSKQKKPNLSKTGPKRRMTDEKKDQPGGTTAPAETPAAPAVAPAPAPAAAPAPAQPSAPTQP
ncbi:peptidyl-prolyl cis-trans isomerase SurA [Silvibacterium bohemicum]|uniref:peptidylprolyl isomerase n=1 Tax=Silvibacterium bohemicum TaxID=1577686 RepID=A0A841JRY5_9BACT|nr:peptidylprolyl isomerase [Silvibacterium bohemicum]MBB6143287.1 peptidyl-prolyl cis-trans isomerase SurA [Silvibacterium bohemicum]